MTLIRHIYILKAIRLLIKRLKAIVKIKFVCIVFYLFLGLKSTGCE